MVTVVFLCLSYRTDRVDTAVEVQRDQVSLMAWYRVLVLNQSEQEHRRIAAIPELQALVVSVIPQEAVRRYAVVIHPVVVDIRELQVPVGSHLPQEDRIHNGLGRMVSAPPTGDLEYRGLEADPTHLRPDEYTLLVDHTEVN